MPQLITNQTFSLSVKSVTPAKESFPGRENKLMYAHYFELVDDEGNIYHAQICDTSNTQQYAQKGDYADFLIKSVSRELYTVSFVKMIRKAEVMLKNASIPANPIVAGTAAAVALGLSVEYSKFSNDESTEEVLTRADYWFDWLKQKTYPS